MTVERDEVDELLESIERPEEGIPMTGPDAVSGEPAHQTPAADQWNAQEWEFDWNGKKVAPDSREKARTWMSQGHNYSQRMAELNMQRQSWDKDKASLEAKYKGYDRYSSIDEYAKKNPEWWAHVEKAYETRGQAPSQAVQQDPALQAALQPLMQELNQLRDFVSEAKADKERLRQEQEQAELKRFDEALSADIKSIREAHPNIDFDAVDQSGLTLEKRILDHAAEIGTAKVSAAFWDYCHPQILESAKATSLSAKAKEEQTNKQAGILSKSPTPRRIADGPVDHRGKSYDDITRMVAEEYGIN